MEKAKILEHLNALFKDRDLGVICDRILIPVTKEELKDFLDGKPSKISLSPMNIMMLTSSVFELVDGGVAYNQADRVHFDALKEVVQPMLRLNTAAMMATANYPKGNRSH